MEHLIFSPVEAIVADIAAGKLVIVADDPGRENEADLIGAASLVTPEMVAEYKEVNKDILSKDMATKMLNVSDLIDPFSVTTVSDEPAAELPEIPSGGLGAPGIGILIFLVIGGLSALGALRMKASNK